MKRTATRNKKNYQPPGAMKAVISGLFKGQIGNLMLLATILISAFTLIIMSHEQRQLFTELENLEQRRDQLDIEWRQLRLEQRVMADYARLEELASEKLDLQKLDLNSERIIRKVNDGD